MTRWGRIITAVVAVLGTAALLANFWRILVPAGAPSGASAPVASLSDVASTAASLPGAPEAKRTAPAVGAQDDRHFEIPPATREKITACLGKNQGADGGKAATLDELVRGFEAEGGAKVELDFENIHVRKPGGDVLRLRLVPGEAPARRVRVFSVDAEGLPVPEPLPETLQDLEPAAAAARFRTLGEPIFESRKTTRRFASGRSASVVEENGRVTELQLFLKTGSLGCAWQDLDTRTPTIDCQCL